MKSGGLWMALDVDGFAVFRGIGSHAEAFAAIATEVAKSARTLVVKQIAHKDTGLKAVRAIRAAVGPEAFGLITDGMSDAQIKSLAVKLDKHNPELKAVKSLHAVCACPAGRASEEPTASSSSDQRSASRRMAVSTAGHPAATEWDAPVAHCL
jgi:hypothetical protein